MAAVPAVVELARWIRAFNPALVTPEVAQLAKLSLLDAIGCALAARSEKTVTDTLRVVEGIGASGTCTIIGTPVRDSLVNAVLANGVLIRVHDFNDHMAQDPNEGTKLGGHPSDCIAAALAVGESRDNTGWDLLVAMVLGYELFGRLQILLDRAQPWDHVTALGFVVPAVAGYLMRLNEKPLANALALSASHCATLGAVRRGQLSAAKFLAGPLVAQNAMLATLLAEGGISGPLEVFEDERGLLRGVVPGKDPLILTAPVGAKLMIEGVTIKAFPSLDTGQAAIAAALELTREPEFRADDIENIEVVMTDDPAIRKQMEDRERRAPKSRETADHSFYFLIAAALLDKELTPRQFANDRWLDPAVCNLMERMTIGSDKGLSERAPDGFPCRIRLGMRDGKERSAEVIYAPGHPRNRLSSDGVVEKFSACTRDVLNEKRRNDVIKSVMSLESSSRVSDLTHLLALS